MTEQELAEKLFQHVEELNRLLIQASKTNIVAELDVIETTTIDLDVRQYAVTIQLTKLLTREKK